MFQVSVQYNTTSLIPGEGLEMVVTADPNSTIYILVEDERNRLIGTESDIFLEEVRHSFNYVMCPLARMLLYEHLKQVQYHLG